MYICYVGNFTPNSVGEPEIAKSLEELGYKVMRVDKSEKVKTIKKVLENNKFDLLLYAKLNTSSYDFEKRELLESLTIPKVCWVFDLYWGI